MKKLFKAFALAAAFLPTLAFAGYGDSINWKTLGNSEGLTAAGYSPTVKVEGFEDLPLYLVTMNNGVIKPLQLVVPAGQKFRIIVHNIGTLPAEFESHQLRFEKVLYTGTYKYQLILPLGKGTYDYFDDWHPGSKQGQILAK